MEKYVAYTTDTIRQMRSEIMACMINTHRENIEFPSDGCLYRRLMHLSETYKELTEELESRNDEIIKP